MKVLSLFDGMACGMIAMKLAGVEIESYDAYEIDKYAIKTAQHNFPMIKEHGDVFEDDFTQYEGVDFLIGGSPCTYWSIAQTKNRETVASGMGWELFSQYVRALHESKPKYFIYENNKSMSKQIRASIDDAFGFEAVCINSALVSAQNRQRLYWVGKRNADGTYSRVNVEQPADRGILLKDVLDSVVAMREMDAEPINVESYEISHTCDFDVTPSGTLRVAYTDKSESQGYRVYCADYKSVAMRAQGNGRGAELVAEPINDIYQVGAMPRPDGEISTSAGFRIYSTEAKGRYLCANGGGAGAKTGLYAIPYEIEFDDYGRPIKAIGKDGKEITIYEVRDGKIAIKGKQYPIKLKDGYYIIRKLTVCECMRLQTVPEWYEFPVSNSQAYKMLGNGWTCEVIAHILEGLKEA